VPLGALRQQQQQRMSTFAPNWHFWRVVGRTRRTKHAAGHYLRDNLITWASMLISALLNVPLGALLHMSGCGHMVCFGGIVRCPCVVRQHVTQFVSAPFQMLVELVLRSAVSLMPHDSVQQTLRQLRVVRAAHGEHKVSRFQTTVRDLVHQSTLCRRGVRHRRRHSRRRQSPLHARTLHACAMSARVHRVRMPCTFLHLPCPYLCASSVCARLPCFLCLHRFESSASCVRSTRWVYTGAPAHVGV